MTISEVKKGNKFKILNIPDEVIRAQALRFGISEGAEIMCIEKIPGGPVVLKRNFQEIAIGRNLANKIEVMKEGESDGML